jgi:hypothetical protein
MARQNKGRSLEQSKKTPNAARFMQQILYQGTTSQLAEKSPEAKALVSGRGFSRAARSPGLSGLQPLAQRCRAAA